MVVVALGEPGVPVTCCASVADTVSGATTKAAMTAVDTLLLIDRKLRGMYLLLDLRTIWRQRLWPRLRRRWPR